MKRKTLVVGMELWEWACWGNEYGIMGMGLLGIMSMELWEWNCWDNEYGIMGMGLLV